MKRISLIVFGVLIYFMSSLNVVYSQTDQIGVIVHLIYDDNNPALDSSLVKPAIEQLNHVDAFGSFADPLNFFCCTNSLS
ncbi:MAG: hypothetical protein ACRBF0_14920 [Calditrichia bacterium]